MDKVSLREQIKGLRNMLSFDEVKESGMLLRAKLADTDIFKNANNVFLYLPIKNEANTIPVAELCFLLGKHVLVPKTEGEFINFYEIKSLDECKKGTFGILEPDKKEIFVPKKEDNNIIIVPGLAFDEKFNRLGYGGGYYDKFFEKNASISFKKIAFAYDFQVLKAIPHEEYDIKMDYILTPTKLMIKKPVHP